MWMIRYEKFTCALLWNTVGNIYLDLFRRTEGKKRYWSAPQHTEQPVELRKCLQSSQHSFSPSQALNDPRMIYSCSSTDDIFFHLPHICYNCTSPIRADAKGQTWPRACSLPEVSWETGRICRVTNGLPQVSILQSMFVREKQEMGTAPLILQLAAHVWNQRK